MYFGRGWCVSVGWQLWVCQGLLLWQCAFRPGVHSCLVVPTLVVYVTWVCQNGVLQLTEMHVGCVVLCLLHWCALCSCNCSTPRGVHHNSEVVVPALPLLSF
jgi:hypothetical protein